MQPATNNNVVPIAPPTVNKKSRMEFMHNGVRYRLRFSYSPDDKVVTRCTIEYQNVSGAWVPWSYAQVFLKGGAVTKALREQERKAALTKLMCAMAAGFAAPRDFARAAWAAYWERGNDTAPSKY